MEKYTTCNIGGVQGTRHLERTSAAMWHSGSLAGWSRLKSCRVRSAAAPERGAAPVPTVWPRLGAPHRAARAAGSALCWRGGALSRSPRGWAGSAGAGVPRAPFLWEPRGSGCPEVALLGDTQLSSRVCTNIRWEVGEACWESA